MTSAPNHVVRRPLSKDSAVVAAEAGRSAAERKAEGAHYTPAALATFVAEKVADALHPLPSGERLRVLDPAVGDASLLIALADVLTARGIEDPLLTGYDTSAFALGTADRRLVAARHARHTVLLEADFLDLAAGLVDLQSGLFGDRRESLQPVDAVIANPPYVRTQVMGAKRAQSLARAFALEGRVDLYFAFVKAIAAVLRPGGVCGIIVSNRFMTTRSGASLRRGLPHDFEILEVVDLGDTRLFEAAVLPAVMILRRRGNKPSCRQTLFTSVYSTRRAPVDGPAVTIFDALKKEGCYQLPSGEAYEVRRGSLDTGNQSDSVWRLSTPNVDQWLKRVGDRTRLTFGDLGPIRVGVKTTSDAVFISHRWSELGEAEPELLRPLLTHHVAGAFRSEAARVDRRILYPYEPGASRRTPIDLQRYPKTQRYLERNRDRLESRSYVRQSGRRWFEIWVPHDPQGWAAPKLVWRDISERPMFWLDTSGAVVNGDCYWLSPVARKLDLLWLALAVANSSFIEAFYDHRFQNRLYARRRRFITQYVQHFPLPDPKTSTAKRLAKLAKRIYESAPGTDVSALKAEADSLTWVAFGLPEEE